MDVADWLIRLGLSEYVKAFRVNHVHPAILKELTADDLKEIGVASVPVSSQSPHKSPPNRRLKRGVSATCLLQETQVSRCGLKPDKDKIFI